MSGGGQGGTGLVFVELTAVLTVCLCVIDICSHIKQFKMCNSYHL